jgi:hypothetical protein
VYLPLYEQLSNIYIDTFSGHRAAKFRDRLSNARDATHSRRRRPIAAARAAWRKLFDKEFVQRGEVAYGGTFPIDALKAIAYRNLAISDPTLLDLIVAAHRERIEGSISDSDLTEKDIKLYDWITAEHDRLKKRA